MEEKEIRQECLKLLDTVNAVYLGTIDENGFPQTRMMSNLRSEGECKVAKQLFDGHDEDFLIYMITGNSSDKMKQIRANPKVSAYYADAVAFHTLMLMGNAQEVDDLELKKMLWQDEWKVHWPAGPEDPEFIILKLLPDSAKGWHKEGPFEFKLK